MEQQFAPVWLFHPEERYFPISIPEYAAQCRIEPGGRPGTEFALWVPTVTPEEQRQFTLVPNDGPRAQIMYAGLNPQAPVYVHSFRTSPQDVYMTYFLFYAVNPAARTVCGCSSGYGFHYADLEHVTVHVHAGQLHRVYYSKHSGGNWVLSDGGRPLVYVALGSHANYETPGFQWRFWGLLPDRTSAQGPVLAHQPLEMVQGPLVFRGTYGDGAVSGFTTKSYWNVPDQDAPYRCS